MGMIIDIKKIEEDENEAVYFFRTYDYGNTGKVSINKKTGECFVLEEPEWDKESELARRVFRILVRHWVKGEFPDITMWAS